MTQPAVRVMMLTMTALVAGCGKDEGDAAAKALTDPRCGAFADRVVACAFDTSVVPAMTPAEQESVRSTAYAVCTRTTDDAAALHYYGDVDRKIACMEGQDCDGVRACLTAD